MIIHPDYRCIAISTKASLREMIPAAALVLLAPLLVGTLFGGTIFSILLPQSLTAFPFTLSCQSLVHAVYGLLTGATLSGVQMAISMSNSGGAWGE